MSDSLGRLVETLEARRGADPATSYVASLYAGGVDRILKKVGEEAVETVIDGVAGPKDRLISESADLLYHLAVLWAARDVDPSEVWAELAKRAK